MEKIKSFWVLVDILKFLNYVLVKNNFDIFWTISGFIFWIILNGKYLLSYSYVCELDILIT